MGYFRGPLNALNVDQKREAAQRDAQTEWAAAICACGGLLVLKCCACFDALSGDCSKPYTCRL